MSDKNPSPGSTMVPTGVSAPSVETKRVSSEELVLDGKTITGVSNDPQNKDPNKLPGSAALMIIKNDLENKIDDLSFRLESTILNPVMSDPIVDEYFYGSFWEKSEDVIFDNGKAQYTNKQEPRPNQAQIRIPTEAIVKPGRYFFAVTVDELPSGDISITNERLETIFTITDPGTYYFEADVINPSIAFFNININYMLELGTCVISWFSVTRVKSIFDLYMDYKVREYAFGNMTQAVNELKAEVRTAIADLQRYVTQATTTTQGMLNMHRNNTNNPHQVKYEQLIGKP